MGVQPRRDSHFHPVPFRLRSLLALVLPVSNRHNHHLVTRKAQEATQTKADSRRRHSERTKRHQTNPTQALGATPPHTHAITRCMQIHYLSAQDVSGRRRSLAPPQRNGISAPKFELLKIQRHSRNLIKFSSFLRRFRAAQSKTKATRKLHRQIS